MKNKFLAVLALVVACALHAVESTPISLNKAQAANTLPMGPSSGGNAVPTMRVPVAGDWTVWNLDLNASKLSSGTVPVARISNLVNANIDAAANIACTKTDGDFGGGVVRSSNSIVSASFFSGNAGFASGTIVLNGSSSGSSTITVPAVAGTSNFTLPVGNGTANQLIKTDGSGNLAYTGTLSVTSIASTGGVISHETINAQTGASYTLVLGDDGLVVTMNNAGANTLSIPTDASVAFPTGTKIVVAQIGAGATTINAVTPGTTTITSTGASPAAPIIHARYGAATLLKTGANAWLVIGNID